MKNDRPHEKLLMGPVEKKEKQRQEKQKTRVKRGKGATTRDAIAILGNKNQL